MNIKHIKFCSFPIFVVALAMSPSQVEAQQRARNLSRMGLNIGIGIAKQAAGASSSNPSSGSGNLNSGGGTIRSVPNQAPNQSGSSNRGGFDASGFFGGLSGSGSNRPSNPAPQPYPNHSTYPQSTYPNSTYPSTTYPQSTYPNTTYPNSTYPNTTYPSTTYPQSSVPPTTYPSSGQPVSSGHPISNYHSHHAPSTVQYPDPPIAPKVYSRLPITIRCPDWCEGECSYQLINGSGKAFDYAIRGGTTQAFKENSDWRIRYQQGPGLEAKTFKLRGGKTYELRREGTGPWSFYMVP